MTHFTDPRCACGCFLVPHRGDWYCGLCVRVFPSFHRLILITVLSAYGVFGPDDLDGWEGLAVTLARILQ